MKVKSVKEFISLEKCVNFNVNRFGGNANFEDEDTFLLLMPPCRKLFFSSAGYSNP
jgi:hypothetical protein